ncbi:MAG: DUF1993 domain-containing protein [Pseudomonadales bacterium]|nr:DUF1993 domain-containing protein [Pseudomonadales bacterium]
MSALSMYEVSIPALIRNLDNLASIIQKGADYAKERELEDHVLVNWRLYPDMLPLAKQVQIASDVSKGAAARLSGSEPPSYEDNESTFEELLARIQKTIDYLKSFEPGQIDGSEDREVVLKAGSSEFKFSGRQYLSLFVLPNVYFHTTTAYNILRHNGVELGKLDYLGNPNQ